VNYFFFVAEEARQLMAQLGIRSWDELIGRTDLLDKARAVEHWKAQGLDFSNIFYQPKVESQRALFHTDGQDHGLDKALDHKLIAQAKAALEKGERVSFISPVRNLNRTVGTMLSGEVAKRYGHAGLPDDTIHIQLQGTAGQSAAAFLAAGITIERFAVRNSGATAVVEGCGDHGCEYMTGGTVVVLAETGRNFAAGMSGGVAYVYDPKGEFEGKCNTTMVNLEPVLTTKQQSDKAGWHSQTRNGERESDEVILRRLIERHFKHTGSTRARNLLDDWANSRGKFVKVFPTDYKRALEEMHNSSMEEANDKIELAA